MPVTTTSSPLWSWVPGGPLDMGSALLDLAGGGVDADDRARGLAVGLVDGALDRVGGAGADPGDLRDLLGGRLPQLLQRAEVLQQRTAAHLAEPGHVVEHALDHRL